MQYVKELLNTGLGTEGQLLLERTIYGSIIEEAEKALLDRSLAALYFGPGQISGASIDVDLVNPNTMLVRETAEGADITVDQVTYTSFNMKPVKYGVGLRITREMLEDGKWNLLDHNAKYAGKRMAENENALVISQSLDSAANTVAGGAAATLANVVRAIQYLEDNDFSATDLIVGNEFMADLRLIDSLVEADKSGSPGIATGNVVGPYGLMVHRVSTNAGMTATTAYVLDRRWGYCIAEKRPVTVEGFELPSHDMTAASVTQRIVTRVLRSSAIAKITTS